MLEIRIMLPEDLEEVAEIERKLFSMPWSRQGFSDSIKSPDTIYLTALWDGRVAGYCGLLQALDEGEITNVAVAEEFQRRGIGAAMLKKLLEIGEERNISRFLLEVRASNLGAAALYKSLGFEEAGIRKNFYEKPREDALIMWREGTSRDFHYTPST